MSDDEWVPSNEATLPDPRGYPPGYLVRHEGKVYVRVGDDRPPWAGVPEYRVAIFTPVRKDGDLPGEATALTVLGTVAAQGDRKWVCVDNPNLYGIPTRSPSVVLLACSEWELTEWIEP